VTRILLLLFLALGAADAALAAETASLCSRTEQDRLHALFKESDEAALELDPLGALGRGDMRFADRFGDYVTDTYWTAREALARKDLARIRGIDRNSLCGADQIAFDVFLDQAQVAVRAFDLGVTKANQELVIDHYFGQHVSFPSFSSGKGVAPFASVADYENGLKRIDGFVAHLDHAQELMRRGIANGHVHHRVIAERVIKQLTDSIDGAAESPFLGPLSNFPPALSTAERERFVLAYKRAVADKITPAYERLRTFMKTEYLPRSREDAPGLSAMRDGATVYAYALEQHTTTKLTAAEIHKLGREEVARIQGEMDRIRVQVGFKGTLSEFFVHVRSDPKFKFNSKNAMLDAYRAVQSRVEERLPGQFLRLPKSTLEIREVPQAQASAVGAYYIPGTPDGSRPGVFYLNTSDLASQSTTRVTSLFLHEGMPGHHLQGSLTQEDTRLPEFLRFGWNTGYGEGWALYAERLGVDMGLYADPFQNFGRLETEIFRAARLVVDTGLHAEGWSRAQAIDFMLANTPLDRAFIEQEVDRYTVWPGQATAYKLGEIFIRRLRARAERALGPKFDVRAFHDEVLNAGAIPLGVLERKIEAWIAHRRN
jgi:uncharacterized protein (DUF885 family)